MLSVSPVLPVDVLDESLGCLVTLTDESNIMFSVSPELLVGVLD
jgi:hypothetical protein